MPSNPSSQISLIHHENNLHPFYFILNNTTTIPYLTYSLEPKSLSISITFNSNPNQNTNTILSYPNFLKQIKVQLSLINHKCKSHKWRASSEYCDNHKRHFCSKCALDHKARFPSESLFNIPKIIPNTPTICSNHNNQIQNYYCTKCDISICLQCKANQKHLTHSIVNLNRILRINDLEELLNKITEFESKYKSHLFELYKIGCDLVKNSYEMSTKIQTSFLRNKALNTELFQIIKNNLLMYRHYNTTYNINLCYNIYNIIENLNFELFSKAYSFGSIINFLETNLVLKIGNIRNKEGTILKIKDRTYQELRQWRYEGPINAVCKLGDAQNYAVGLSIPYVIHVVNIYSGEIVRTLMQHSKEILCWCLWKRFDFLLSSSRDNTMCIWNYMNGELVNQTEIAIETLCHVIELPNGWIAGLSHICSIFFYNTSEHKWDKVQTCKEKEIVENKYDQYPSFRVIALKNNMWVTGHLSGHVRFINYTSNDKEVSTETIVKLDNKPVLSICEVRNFFLFIGSVGVIFMFDYCNFCFVKAWKQDNYLLNVYDMIPMDSALVGLVTKVKNEIAFQIWNYEKNIFECVVGGYDWVIKLNENEILVSRGDEYEVKLFSKE